MSGFAVAWIRDRYERRGGGDAAVVTWPYPTSVKAVVEVSDHWGIISISLMYGPFPTLAGAQEAMLAWAVRQ